MKVSASVVVDSRTTAEHMWTWPICGRGLLDHALDTLKNTCGIDDYFVFTDVQDIIDRLSPAGLVVPFMDRFTYNFNFLDNISLFTELYSLKQADRLGDIHFFLDMRFPLIDATILGGMYNKLLETRFAAKVIPTYEIDPNLIMRIGTSDTFMRLWDSPGLDRQLQPRLMRITGACVVHCKRIAEIQPLTMHYRINRNAGRIIQDKGDIELMQYICNKKSAMPRRENSLA